ncbi:angiomotin-like 2a [Sinocyclocheilus anshuiensis]|uniref:Angiomotin-like 2a n=1 Tax=Sinocyclocheilus anshuiensis TaxID=1608454 RepID=A0A671LWF7_9TELE|nr:PREDICTED: angiomotin-like 2a [Sinocyclocheilus anshuiensis]
MPLTESVWNESFESWSSSDHKYSSPSNKMRGEEASGTVLHRLIQEQLRYGNPTDAHTLLAIQQQALRRGGGVGGGSRGTGSSQSSSESLSQEEPQSLQLSARQEPQGQEHQVDYQHSENYTTYPHHGEELPTYEQAKAQSQYLASQWCQLNRGCSLQDSETIPKPCEEEDSWDPKRGHVRSLSERLLQFSGERSKMPATCSASYPQIHGYHANQHLQYSQQGLEYNRQVPYTEYPFPAQQAAEYEHYYKAPPAFHSQHNRLQTPEVCHRLSTSPPAGREVTACSRSQLEMLMKENKRLKQELEGHTEKALRIQKLEQEIQRISEAYDTLMKGCAKRETLEQVLRNKLMAEIKRLQHSSIQAAKEAEDADQNQHVIEKLLLQNEEQQLQCAHLEQEVQHLRNEVENQQHRSEALETALRSTQTRSQQLWTELQRKRAYVEKVERLQGALTQLQTTCKKREGLETRLRTRLEQELRSLRNQQRQPQPVSVASHVSVSTLQELLREKEERILSLEADKTRWEQKYLEEKTMREFAMDAAATAAAQRDTTIINHSPCHSFIEELPLSEHKNQEVENRIRALYAQILEKDTVISFLKQKLQRESGDPQLATAEPSITISHSTVTHIAQVKGKSHSNDQATGTSHLALAPEASPGQPEKVLLEKQTTDQTSHTETSSDNIQKAPSALDLFKGLDNVAADVVEIFI